MGDDKKSDSPPIAASSRFEWSDMRVFLAVAELRSISAASKPLQLSQPTISAKMRDLELRLNTQLFTRSTAGVVLTEAGEKLRDAALPMLRASQEIDRTLREFDDKPDGRVRLSAPDGVLAYWIAPRVAAFQRANPGICLSMDGGFWPDDPVRDEIDISLQFDERKFGEHTVEPLATVHYGPLTTRRYLELYGTPKSQAEMAQHRTILHSAFKQQRETWDPKAEAVRTLSAYNVETNSSAAMGMVLLTHGGIAFMPTYVCSYYEDVVMLGDAPAASPKLYLVYDQRLTRVARAAKVLAWLQEIFDPASQPWFQTDFVHPRQFAMAQGAGRLSVDPPA
jgi:DNA-binding transcriptional LysR family regulator